MFSNTISFKNTTYVKSNLYHFMDLETLEKIRLDAKSMYLSTSSNLDKYRYISAMFEKVEKYKTELEQISDNFDEFLDIFDPSDLDTEIDPKMKLQIRKWLEAQNILSIVIEPLYRDLSEAIQELQPNLAEIRERELGNI